MGSKYLFGCVSAAVGEILLNLHDSNSARMPCKPCKFGCDRPIIKGTLLRERTTFRLYLSFHWRDNEALKCNIF